MQNLQLSPIVAQKTSEVLARQLRRQILNTLPPGSPLPTERDLMAQTGLGRGSVREALRILEAENLVTTRPGRFGGSITQRPNDQSLGRSISLFAQGTGVTLESLLQTREAVQPSLAGLAARNRTESDLAQMRECSEKLQAARSNLPQFLQENVNWHMAIAVASGNQLLRAVMSSISVMIYKATAVENYATEEALMQVVRAHSGIEAAIAAQDEESARRRMARHLSAVTASWKVFPDAPLVLDF